MHQFLISFIFLRTFLGRMKRSDKPVGSTNLISPDWSSPQSVNMNLVGGGGVKTNNPLSQMEKDSLDLVFVSVIPYTGS